MQQRHAPYQLCLAVVEQDAAAARRHDLLTPVIMTGTGIQRGFLTSATSHGRPGILINLDLTASILHFFAIRPHESILGLPLYSVPATDALARLQAFNDHAVAIYVARAPVIIAFIAFLAIGTFLCVRAVAFNRRPLAGARAPHPLGIRVLLVGAMLAPLMLLLAPGCHFTRRCPSRSS